MQKASGTSGTCCWDDGGAGGHLPPFGKQTRGCLVTEDGGGCGRKWGRRPRAAPWGAPQGGLQGPAPQHRSGGGDGRPLAGQGGCLPEVTSSSRWGGGSRQPFLVLGCGSGMQSHPYLKGSWPHKLEGQRRMGWLLPTGAPGAWQGGQSDRGVPGWGVPRWALPGGTAPLHPPWAPQLCFSPRGNAG